MGHVLSVLVDEALLLLVRCDDSLEAEFQQRLSVYNIWLSGRIQLQEITIFQPTGSSPLPTPKILLLQIRKLPQILLPLLLILQPSLVNLLLQLLSPLLLLSQHSHLLDCLLVYFLKLLLENMLHLDEVLFLATQHVDLLL